MQCNGEHDDTYVLYGSQGKVFLLAGGARNVLLLFPTHSFEMK